MTSVTYVFLGMLLGALLMWLVQLIAQRHATIPHASESDYTPARRAVIRHLRAHGTINLEQLERMLDISAVFALRHLDRMVADGLLKRQGHRSKGAFYTLA